MITAGHGRPDFYLTVRMTNHPTLAVRKHRPHLSSAFTLHELLVVVAVICVMMTLLVPAVSSMTSSGGRKGAVTIVMNTLEQARMAAIEKSREVVVVFWKKNGTTGSQPDEQDAILVLRRDDLNNWEPITRWVKLPKGVLFHGEDAQSDIMNDSSSLADGIDTANLPGNPDKSNLGAVQFSSSGAVQLPSTSIGLRVALTEGQRNESGALVPDKQKSGGFEVISIARYTGRTTLDITSL
jgi:Tfp pilus assembly protein FimT